MKLLVSAWSSQEDSSSVTVQQEDPSPEVKVTVDSYQTIAVIFFNAACVKSHTTLACVYSVWLTCVIVSVILHPYKVIFIQLPTLL